MARDPNDELSKLVLNNQLATNYANEFGAIRETIDELTQRVFEAQLS